MIPKAKKTYLRLFQKEQELNWAREQVEWKFAVLSGKKKFNLHDPDRLGSYWHDLRKKSPVFR